MENLFYQAAKKACITALEKHGKDPLLIHLDTFSSIADYIVIISSRSSVHGRGLADAITDALMEFPIRRRGIEQDPGGLWILLDYYGLVIHIFDEDERRYYNLERLWKDAKVEVFKEENLVTSF